MRVPVRKAFYVPDGVIDNWEELRSGQTDVMLLRRATDESVAFVLPHTALGAIGLHIDEDATGRLADSQ